MKKISLFITLLPLIAVCQEVNIIPQPAELKLSHQAAFRLTGKTQIVVDERRQKLKASADFLNQYLKKNYGFSLQLVSTHPAGNYIALQIAPPATEMTGRHDHSYSVTVKASGISISGEDDDGIFSGIQTLIQLLPVKTSRPFVANIPALYINDYPHFPYRGMHLDVGRHFFPVAFIKKYIDYLALHKFNYFHWHLTEDQGWRIEIKKYPNLTKTGAWRNGTITGRYPGTGSDNTIHGGFYTQEEVKEIVKYAADRFITVIPEIEMPGHSSAAIASYPWLSCFPGELTKIPASMISKKSVAEQQAGRVKLVQETWGVFDDVFCAGKDSTFGFLEDVLDEVLSLFPSKYIHVGGDESPKTNWKRCPLCQKRIKDEGLKDEHELQSYFIQRIEKYLNSKGRTLIGWDEILEGGLAPNAIVMSWRGEEGGIAAARQKHDVIMTPGGWVYFDHSQSQYEDSVTIGSYTPIEKVYGYKPVPDSLTAEQGKYVLGAQANVWTEYIANARKVEYMIFPRIAALSEVLWSQKKDWTDFEKRLQTQFKRYDLWKANYSRAYFDLKTAVLPAPDGNGVMWKLESKQVNLPIRVNRWSARNKIPVDVPQNDKNGNRQYVLKDAYRKDSFLYSGPVKIAGHGFFEAILLDKRNNKLVPISNPVKQSFQINKATGKRILLATPPSQNYPGDGGFTLVNGVWNEKGLARSTEFLGFNGGDCEATIDLGTVRQIANVKAHVFEQTPSWIWRPKYFQVLISQDDKTYTEMGMTDVVVFIDSTNRNAVMTVQQKSVAARWVKIRLGNYGMIPTGNPGAGNKPWLFVDEIEIN